MAAAAVGVAAAERGQLGLVELGGGLRGGELGQEGQGDLGGEPEEQLLGAGPVSVQERAELVAGRGLGGNMVIAQPDQRLQLAGDRVHRLQPAQPVAVGTQVVRELVAIARIGLGAGGTPAGPGGMECPRVDRDHRVAGGEQPVDNQAVGAFDRHGQVSRAAVAGQAGQHRVQVLLGVRGHPAVDHLAGGVEDGHGMTGARPVPPGEQHGCLQSLVVLIEAR